MDMSRRPTRAMKRSPEWRATPEGKKYVARLARKRRARAKLHATITTAEWEALKAFWGGCAYCQATDRPLTRDCILPLRGHGIYAVFNVVPACASCNSSKSGKHVIHWMRRKGHDIEWFEERALAWWMLWIKGLV